jgi:hypothetical protein
MIVALLFLKSADVGYGRDQPAAQFAPLAFDDIAGDWRHYEGALLTLTARMRCDDEDYCFLIGPRQVRKIVLIDLSKLPAADKRHAVIGCHDTPCAVVVGGRALDDAMMVTSITDDVGAAPRTTLASPTDSDMVKREDGSCGVPGAAKPWALN